MAKSRRNKNGVNGAATGTEDQEEEEEEMAVVENSEGEEEEGAGSPVEVDSGHETAEEAMQVCPKMCDFGGFRGSRGLLGGYA